MGVSGTEEARRRMVEGMVVVMLEIARLQRVLDKRPRTLERWFCEAELVRAKTRARPAEDLAGRLACKLAVRQVLQPYLPAGAYLPLCEISISNDSLGKPLAALTGDAALLAVSDDSPLEIHVSITHARYTAAAVAVLSTIPGSENW